MEFHTRVLDIDVITAFLSINENHDLGCRVLIRLVINNVFIFAALFTIPKNTI